MQEFFNFYKNKIAQGEIEFEGEAFPKENSISISKLILRPLFYTYLTEHKKVTKVDRHDNIIEYEYQCESEKFEKFYSKILLTDKKIDKQMEELKKVADKTEGLDKNIVRIYKPKSSDGPYRSNTDYSTFDVIDQLVEDIEEFKHVKDLIIAVHRCNDHVREFEAIDNKYGKKHNPGELSNVFSVKDKEVNDWLFAILYWKVFDRCIEVELPKDENDTYQVGEYFTRVQERCKFKISKDVNIAYNQIRCTYENSGLLPKAGGYGHYGSPSREYGKRGENLFGGGSLYEKSSYNIFCIEYYYRKLFQKDENDYDLSYYYPQNDEDDEPGHECYDGMYNFRRKRLNPITKIIYLLNKSKNLQDPKKDRETELNDCCKYLVDRLVRVLYHY